MLGGVLRKVDRGVYQCERFIVASALLAMSFIVFADVVYRIFSYRESRLAMWIVAGLQALGVDIADRGDGYALLRDRIAPILLFLLFALLVFLALRSSPRTAATRLHVAMGLALAITLGGWGAVQGLMWVAPNGIGWAQTFALILLLWVGFFGASMCTYEGKHLRVEVAERLWPAWLLPWVRLVTNLLTAAFTVFIVVLGVMFVQFNHGEWVATDGRGGTFQGMRQIPRWAAFLALPIAFGIMSMRFVAAGVVAAMGGTYATSGADPAGRASGSPTAHGRGTEEGPAEPVAAVADDSVPETADAGDEDAASGGEVSR